MNSIKILVVEDDAIIARDVQLTLELLGYEVGAVAHDGFEALRQLGAQSFDLAVMDIHLGAGPSGLDIAARIRQDYGFPVIFLTSFADRTTLSLARDTQPVSYVVKPFEEHDLLAAVEIGLANFAQRTLQPGLQIETLNRVLPTALTQREFEMLEDICTGKNNLQIAERHFVSINTVKTHVKRLFEKLDVHSRSEAILKVQQIQKGK